DEMQVALVMALPGHAAFDGWTMAALDAAADECGVARAAARLAFKGGAVEMIDAWFARIDAAMQGNLPPELLAEMKIRTRITALIEARLALLRPHREALRCALGVLGLPRNVAHGGKLMWRSADAMWRAAGDTATDFNHYTKRATLGAVYGSTIMVFLSDESEAYVETRAFLVRRIENIMQFEKAKAGLRARRTLMFDPVKFLGRLRYAN
ncbi:MAG: COQ9 family protein, partial [Alphaproteobacteria bacterium]|nr:COQ9 family protein [Alphaproteobacteria bacterium]